MRIPERDHQLAHLQLRSISQCHWERYFATCTKYRKVRERVAADDVGLRLGAV
jgi:hypothetical protein